MDRPGMDIYKVEQSMANRFPRGGVLVILVSVLALGGCFIRPQGQVRWDADSYSYHCSGFHTNLQMGRLCFVFPFQPTAGLGTDSGSLDVGGFNRSGGGEDPASWVLGGAAHGVTIIRILGHVLRTDGDGLWVDGKPVDYDPRRNSLTVLIRRDGRVDIVGEKNQAELMEVPPAQFTYERFVELRPLIVQKPMDEEASRRLWVRLMAERVARLDRDDEPLLAALRQPENFQRLMAEYAASHDYLLSETLRFRLNMSEEEIRVQVAAARQEATRHAISQPLSAPATQNVSGRQAEAAR